VINLVAPVPRNPYTGGHLVNDRLAEDSRVRVLYASSLADATNLLTRTAQPIVIVDSLFLPDTAGLHAIRECAGGSVGLIAHSLPSLIPGPTSVDRCGMLDTERASLALFDFAIAPSEFMVRALVRRGLPRERAFQVTPTAAPTRTPTARFRFSPSPTGAHPRALMQCGRHSRSSQGSSGTGQLSERGIPPPSVEDSMMRFPRA